MFRKSVLDNMGTDFSSLEILQKPEVSEDQLKYWARFEIPWNFLTTSTCIFHGKKLPFFDGLRFTVYLGPSEINPRTYNAEGVKVLSNLIFETHTVKIRLIQGLFSTCFENDNCIHANSPGYGTDLLLSCTGHQTSPESSFELFYALVWVLAHF